MMSANESIDCEECNTRRPTEPLASDCCGTGCNPCVFDLYETELRGWRESCDRCHEGGAQIEHQETKQQDTSQEDAFSINKYRSFKLYSITTVSHDTAIYRFTLPVNTRLNLGVGQHIILRGLVNCHSITRQYTPISDPGTRNQFEVLIKVYKDGAMSTYIQQWTVGDLIEWRGPYGTFLYQPNQYRRIIMLAAGTGITPVLQVIRHIVTDDSEETFVRLLYSCRTYEDLLLREKLNELTEYWNFTMLYVLSREKPGEHSMCYGETFHYGRINKELLILEINTSIDQETQILICGTKSFEKDMINFLKKLDFKGNIFKF